MMVSSIADTCDSVASLALVDKVEDEDEEEEVEPQNKEVK
jgi:hypothetical protein